jgi:cold shock protein
MGMGTGTVIRFDDVRGYGFIAPHDGGEDVFVHVNDLAESGRVAVGTRVAFRVAEGDRGLKAYDVRVIDERPSAQTASTAGGDNHREPAGKQLEVDDDLLEVLREQEFLQQVTELLLTTAPHLTGEMVVELRRSFLRFARQNGWVE